MLALHVGFKYKKPVPLSIKVPGHGPKIGKNRCHKGRQHFSTVQVWSLCCHPLLTCPNHPGHSPLLSGSLFTPRAGVHVVWVCAGERMYSWEKKFIPRHAKHLGTRLQSQRLSFYLLFNNIQWNLTTHSKISGGREDGCPRKNWVEIRARILKPLKPIYFSVDFLAGASMNPRTSARGIVKILKPDCKTKPNQTKTKGTQPSAG